MTYEQWRDEVIKNYVENEGRWLEEPSSVDYPIEELRHDLFKFGGFSSMFSKDLVQWRFDNPKYKWWRSAP